MNQLKIEPHIPNGKTGYYCIYVKRKWFFFSYWKKIIRYLQKSDDWNPVLLKYEEAKAFAIKMRDPTALEAFEKEQLELEKSYAVNLYPVDVEYF